MGLFLAPFSLATCDTFSPTHAQRSTGLPLCKNKNDLLDQKRPLCTMCQVITRHASPLAPRFQTRVLVWYFARTLPLRLHSSFLAFVSWPTTTIPTPSLFARTPSPRIAPSARKGR